MKRKRVLIPIIVFTIIIIVLIIVLNSSHKYSLFSISESKWNAIVDVRTENNNLKLENIEFNDYKLIIDEKNNIVYYSLLNDSKSKYNPTVKYSSNDKNAKIVFLEDEITNEKVKSDYEFKIMIYNEKQYRIYHLKCTDLPILSINYKENSINKPNNIPMEMYLFDNLSKIPNKIIVSNGRIRENENGYEFSLDMLTPGKNKRENIISLLNMKPNSEYMLTLADEKNDENLDNSNRRIELFINNEYKGLYVINSIEWKAPIRNDMR